MGFNEFAGYVALALSTLATGYVAARYGLRPAPFQMGIGFVAIGLLLSAFLVRDTRDHVHLEAQAHSGDADAAPIPSQAEIFRLATYREPTLSSISQAGLVNNLNDGLAWGLFPLAFAAAGMSLAQIGALAALYPAVWGFGQLVTGGLSDRIGRKGLIVWGMWTQAIGIAVIAMSDRFAGFAGGAVLLGVGTAMVYPTLLAAIGDVAHPRWRASAVGVYRLWRDLGYAFGAVLADRFGIAVAIWVTAAITFGSGTVSALRMRESSGASRSP